MSHNIRQSKVENARLYNKKKIHVVMLTKFHKRNMILKFKGED